MSQEKHQEETLVDVMEDVTNESELVLYNDDHNTFDWVIECLIDICDHTHISAEQISLMVHFNGKAIIKTAYYEKLKPLKDCLIDRGLSAVIEGVNA